eukprot:TRINITY_DN14442_c0_g1_i1.p1 TRINITY_DN14442_c0_g1~~TRINITY_DN14442_c0_g1_i1.p1  ORF type:complete len:270 (-),score=51.40 TRINITY_DN14442_c0_g1_i1:286-1095(-)
MDNAIPISIIPSMETAPTSSTEHPSKPKVRKPKVELILPQDSLIEESQQLFGSAEATCEASESKHKNEDERKQLAAQIKAVCDAKGIKPISSNYIQPSACTRLKTQKLRDELVRVTNAQSDSLIISSSSSDNSSTIDSSSVPIDDTASVVENADEPLDDDDEFDEDNSELNPIFKDHVPLFMHELHKSVGLVLESVTRSTSSKTGVSLQGFSDAIESKRDSFIPMYLAILEEHQRNNVVKQLCTPTMSFVIMNAGIAMEIFSHSLNIKN